MIGSSKRYFSHEIFNVLPEDLNGEIFQHFNSVDLIFSISNVCKSWREYSFPILLKQYEPIAKIIGDERVVSSIHYFFNHENGRKYIKRSLREYVYNLADHLINRISLKKGNTDKEIHFEQEQWLMKELELAQYYFSFYSSLDLIISGISNSTTSSNNGLFGSVLNYLGMLFTKNSDTSVSRSTKVSTLMETNHDPTNRMVYKCVMDGYCGVGKSSFVNCISKNESVLDVDQHVPASIGASLYTKTYHFGTNERPVLQLWDFAGSERFHVVSPAYYRGANVVFLLFDLSDSNSFNSSCELFRELSQNYNDLEIIMIGNKKDLTRKVKSELAESFSMKEMSGSLYLEISNTDITQAHIIALYSVLISYLNQKSLNK